MHVRACVSSCACMCVCMCVHPLTLHAHFHACMGAYAEAERVGGLPGRPAGWGKATDMRVHGRRTQASRARRCSQGQSSDTLSTLTEDTSAASSGEPHECFGCVRNAPFSKNVCVVRTNDDGSGPTSGNTSNSQRIFVKRCCFRSARCIVHRHLDAAATLHAYSLAIGTDHRQHQRDWCHLQWRGSWHGCDIPLLSGSHPKTHLKRLVIRFKFMRGQGRWSSWVAGWPNHLNEFHKVRPIEIRSLRGTWYCTRFN